MASSPWHDSLSGVPTRAGAGQSATAVSSDDLVPSLECARDTVLALLVGYLGGVPASSAILFVVGWIAGLTGVATVPEYRRRGLAEALTWAASGDVVHASGIAVGRALPLLCLAGARGGVRHLLRRLEKHFL
ncbi:MAG: hypothetical protein U0840_09610 [Gemmataceae bacterium]